jgi:hypothetical protein
MKQIKKYSVFPVFFLLIGLFSYYGDNLIPKSLNAEELSANLSRIWTQPEKIEPVLQNYPFPQLTPAVTIAEGFEAYDGNLGDKVGGFHWSIDYVQKDGDNYLSFPVYSMHDGIAFQGYGKTWGKFVVVRKRDLIKQIGYNTLYSHLDNIPKNIPFMNSDIDNSKGILIASSTYIGDASTSGNTKGINQLHLEFHQVNMKNGITLRLDPYGTYLRLSSGLYPVPGISLKGLPHYFKNDLPGFTVVR